MQPAHKTPPPPAYDEAGTAARMIARYGDQMAWDIATAKNQDSRADCGGRDDPKTAAFWLQVVRCIEHQTEGAVV